MSLFQCQHCGCCENTALASQGCDGHAESFFDWTSFEDRRGKKLCSVCAPTKYSDGTPTKFGNWHGRFDRVFLPMGEFRTARNGNLEHVDTGDQDFRKYALSAPYLVDRADGVRGHYAVGRWNPEKQVQEVWNLRSFRWTASSDDVLDHGNATKLLGTLTRKYQNGE